MKSRYLQPLYVLGAATLAMTVLAAPKPDTPFEWMTVINNNDLIPPLEQRTFNSYNQPSVNANGLVVIRARSRGGPPLGPATHGIYTRDMSVADSEIVRILDKTSTVPNPNNLGSKFTETPSFSRIDMHSATIATRGNHGPVHRYSLGDEEETRAGTTGIYTNPFGDLITGAAKLGHVPEFSFFGVPEFGDIPFEVFPGAPSVTNGNTIVFKGNFTAEGIGRTGVYYRDLTAATTGGTSLAVMIANSAHTLIPGTEVLFGSTAPPNAAGSSAVFAGFDNEAAPTLGGIYLAPLQYQPSLQALVSIGDRVPGQSVKHGFTALGEAIAFDGRFVGFWGAWGDQTQNVKLHCKEEGNKDRIAYCNQSLYCAATGETLGDPGSICDDEDDPKFGKSCYSKREVPVQQGIFVHDTKTGRTHLVADRGKQVDDFLYWNFSGRVPCASHGHSAEGGEDDGEFVRWRSSAFVAVSAGVGATFNTAFKARSGGLSNGVYLDPIDGIYIQTGPGQAPVITAVDTTMNGQVLDPEAPPDSTIAEVGLEREGLRGSWLAINASMEVDGGEEEDGMAGVYITQVE
ncbi:MAG: hypothetical protein ACR2QX_11300 [Woeseiaceae bacterium]